MEMAEFIEQDILIYLDELTDSEGDAAPKGGGASTIFLTRDYEKEIAQALDANSIPKAKQILHDLKDQYDQCPDNTVDKEHLKLLLTTLYEKFKDHLASMHIDAASAAMQDNPPRPNITPTPVAAPATPTIPSTTPSTATSVTTAPPKAQAPTPAVATIPPAMTAPASAPVIAAAALAPNPSPVAIPASAVSPLSPIPPSPAAISPAGIAPAGIPATRPTAMPAPAPTARTATPQPAASPPTAPPRAPSPPRQAPVRPRGPDPLALLAKAEALLPDARAAIVAYKEAKDAAGAHPIPALTTRFMHVHSKIMDAMRMQAKAREPTTPLTATPHTATPAAETPAMPIATPAQTPVTAPPRVLDLPPISTDPDRELLAMIAQEKQGLDKALATHAYRDAMERYRRMRMASIQITHPALAAKTREKVERIRVILQDIMRSPHAQERGLAAVP